ncbi:MSHA biogenesis protein MshJ [Shewanella maritima]|uniref:MSHA biogenesis protein MshJ n=1 Tax=Shewanella maritima TaxID=2520507 RepID=A0A411PI78_9GAMM|nr:MSHA biogenesis protein MshJ [Shewanella maritima]QBF83321.1 MSHA biogenesis protein MshJ [Shewanella maritima]
MNQQWQQLETKFNDLSQRERGLIALVVIIIVAMVAFTLLEGQFKDLQRLKGQLTSLENENRISEQQIALYEQRLKLDPNDDYRQRLVLLEEQMAQVDAELKSQMIDMVPADYMPTVLSNLLANMKGVTLESFASIPPVPLIQVGEQEKMNLYSHGIRLSLTGDYFSIMKFVQAVEDMPDKLFWERLDYQVDSYPKGTIELEMYTLSINKDFIGVAKQD